MLNKHDMPDIRGNYTTNENICISGYSTRATPQEIVNQLPAHVFAVHQQMLRQTQALNQGFQSSDYRRSGGN